jgi:hypothetical protein
MEIRRFKNVATYIVFPIKKNDGTLITGAAGLDSEIDSFADASAPDGFTDCTNEATEIASTGIYYLSLAQAECNVDYAVVQVKSSTSGAITQVILINFVTPKVDTVSISGDSTAADNLEAACDGGTYNVGGGAVVAASVTTKTGYELAAAYDAAKTAASQTSLNAVKAKTDAWPAILI